MVGNNVNGEEIRNDVNQSINLSQFTLPLPNVRYSLVKPEGFLSPRKRRKTRNYPTN